MQSGAFLAATVSPLKKAKEALARSLLLRDRLHNTQATAFLFAHFQAEEAALKKAKEALAKGKKK